MKLRTRRCTRGRSAHIAFVVTVVPALLLPLFLTGCVTTETPEGGDEAGDEAGSEEIPSWYLNPDEKYPEDRYMTAVGSGETRRAAEEQAYAGLSQAFEIDIRVDSTTQERYREIMTEEGNMTESEVELSQTVEVQSGQELLNVRTAEAAVDDRGRVRTIAYIERQPTGNIYAELIRENDEQISSLVNEADEADDPVRRYAYLNSAAVVARNNELLLEQLRIISPAIRNTIDISYDPNDLVSRRADAAQEIRVAVDLEVEADGGGDGESNETSRVETALREAISAERFVMDEQDPVLRLSADVEMRPIELNPDFETVRWVLDLELRREGGASIVSQGENGRVSANTIESARAMAYSDIQNLLEEEFSSRLSGYFDSLVLGD